MLQKVRVCLATAMFCAVTVLFLDFTGTVHAWLGWTAKIQFLPALLAFNFIIVALLIALTLVFGRVYCSVICPLGIFQDIVSWLGSRSRQRRHRFRYSPALNWLRIGVLVLFVVAFVAGIAWFVALLAPYSAYGRMVQNLFAPLWQLGNNLLAALAERADSYAFYEKEIWLRNIYTFAIAAATFLIIGFLAWRSGRTYCNTICPVGTVLGFFARFSWFKPVINTDKCNSCGLCGRSCKSSCIDSATHTIDYSRCVACMDCLSVCHRQAISYTHRNVPHAVAEQPDSGRRACITIGAAAIGSAMVSGANKTVDGGLAAILDKKAPARKVKLVPAGAQGISNFTQRCTACQLCVSVCPNDVLRPSQSLRSLMQPEMSYERGYCRPECTRCSEVCPTGAIRLTDVATKSSTQIGHAVWVKANCVPLTDGVECGNCARHCPAGAITMVEAVAGKPKIPAVNVERCIGCGACENLCPARPFSAIYVEGHEQHREI